MSDKLGLLDIHIRDPFVLPVHGEGLYYLYGTSGAGFDCYTSPDLVVWYGPYAVFRPQPGFWADRDFWAPEVHRYDGRYFLLASLKAEGSCRGTQVFAAEGPTGPFRPWSDGPVTPRSWECLDGTLYIDESGAPWMVFCHEWLQVGDGRMCAIPLTGDLSAATGDPITLFCASDAGWPVDLDVSRDAANDEGVGPAVPGSASPGSAVASRAAKVTDGPFVYRSVAGELCLLWSSFGPTGYCTTVARSASGQLSGPWVHDPKPFFTADGGHAMLFADWQGTVRLALHAPNRSPDERPVFVEFGDASLSMRSPLHPLGA